MRTGLVGVTFGLIAGALGLNPVSAFAQAGFDRAWIQLDQSKLDEIGLSLDCEYCKSSTELSDWIVRLAEDGEGLMRRSPFFERLGLGLQNRQHDLIYELYWTWTIQSSSGTVSIAFLDLEVGASGVRSASLAGTVAFSDENIELPLGDLKLVHDSASGVLMLEAGEVIVTPAVGQRMGIEVREETSIGTLRAVVQISETRSWLGWTDHLESNTAGGVGPDVIVGELHNFNNYGTDGTLSAFSVGTTSCNIGDTPLSWIDDNNQHPVIGQNMFRLKDGSFEQIGQSWLKHGFLALAENACSLGCQNPGTGALLGVGCSDPYSANLNGAQSNLGPKSEVNPHTGFFPYPPGNPQWAGGMARRLQVKNSDLDPAQDGGGLYFVEGQYVAADDAAAGHNNNNASYKKITITAGAGGAWNMAFAGSTVRQKAGIRAWKDNDASVVETDVQVPGEGLFLLSAKATHLGDGLWHYEYALYNMNSDRAAGAFTVPVPEDQIVLNPGFHDVSYHSGEPFDGTDWEFLPLSSGITWSTTPYGTNPDANALRWATLYNFRFDVHAVPTPTNVTIGLFKPGSPEFVLAATIGPAVGPVDCNANGHDDRCDLDCNALDGHCMHEGVCGDSVDCDNSGQPDECELDCNDNGVFDSCDLADGTSADCNVNLVPDECDPDHDGDETPDTCDGDIDNDGVLNGPDACDFTPLGASIRTNGATVGDINSDCDVDLVDYSHFDECFNTSGPGDPPNTPACVGLYDYDHDGDLDMQDFAGIEVVFTGAGG